MKIIDAVWEKRNLGVNTLEIVIERDDTIDEIKKKLDTIHEEYMVIKVPAERTDVMLLLPQFGFSFIECTIKVTHNLKNLNLTGIQKRLVDAVSYELMNEDDIEQLFDEIKKGLFYTDRIYLDPYFTKEQAANRYIGWIKDEISRGTDLYKYIYKDKTFGFFTFKDLGNDEYYPFLAGVYSDHINTGLGFAFNYKPLMEAIRRNGKLISTYISTNNLNTIRMHNVMGFSFDEVSYVYIKHS